MRNRWEISFCQVNSVIVYWIVCNTRFKENKIKIWIDLSGSLCKRSLAKFVSCLETHCATNLPLTNHISLASNRLLECHLVYGLETVKLRVVFSRGQFLKQNTPVSLYPLWHSFSFIILMLTKAVTSGCPIMKRDHPTIIILDNCYAPKCRLLTHRARHCYCFNTDPHKGIIVHRNFHFLQHFTLFISEFKVEII